MLLESQDVVGESCPSQFDSESSSAMMASMRAEVPRMSIDKSNNSSWLQRSKHEAEPRRVCSDWNSKRPSASAMVLARKRKRDEQWKLLNSKKQCTDSDSSEYNAGDSERDSLDMEEQLTAFVEYNATDMDSLDINPSQDFDGDDEQNIATQASQNMQTCSWEDVTDVNQFQEEASEVFDNVIYTLRPPSIPVASTYCRPQGKSELGIARSSFLPKAKAIPEKKTVVGPPSDDSEGSLSDGFDVAINLTNKTKTTTRPPTAKTSCSGASPKQESKPEWRQRRSVKRDCSFIDNSSSYSVNGRLLLMASPTTVNTSEVYVSEASSDRVIELKDGCFDSSDDAETVSMRDTNASSTVPSSVSATTDTVTTMSSSLPSSTGYSGALQPRLARKRRKVGQLTLDGFSGPRCPES